VGEGTGTQRLTDTQRNASVTNVLQVTVDVAGPNKADADLARFARHVADTMVPVP
jgi:hypothetical protein